MSKHTECGAVGKFDCLADEYIYGTTLESGAGEGDVEASCAWFEEVTLDTSDPKEQAAIEHYGTRYLIARENSQGIFWVETYDTEQARDERLEGLRQAFAEWDTDVLS